MITFYSRSQLAVNWISTSCSVSVTTPWSHDPALTWRPVNSWSVTAWRHSVFVLRSTYYFHSPTGTWHRLILVLLTDHTEQENTDISRGHKLNKQGQGLQTFSKSTSSSRPCIRQVYRYANWFECNSLYYCPKYCKLKSSQVWDTFVTLNEG